MTEKLTVKGQTYQMRLCSMDKCFQLEMTQNKTPCKESIQENKTKQNKHTKKTPKKQPQYNLKYNAPRNPIKYYIAKTQAQ